MPRRTAAKRHLDSAPPTPTGEESGSELVEVLTAFYHPTRRWLFELLSAEGAASVGVLAARTDLAPGSVSHHLKKLHRHGFVEPAPDLARDTRESWWRVVPRWFSWSADDFLEGTAGRRIVDAAEMENFRHEVRAVQLWLVTRSRVAEAWRRSAGSTATYVPATVEQLADLGDRLSALLAEWSAECKADREARPDVERRPVRATARVFPSGPVKP